jgi:hypothetical protein
MRHGNNGDGKGEIAIGEKLTLSDFSDMATLRNKTDGELFYMIKVSLARIAASFIGRSSYGGATITETN